MVGKIMHIEIIECLRKTKLVVLHAGCGSMVLQAYATKLFREEHQTIGLSTVSAAWGIGLIIGPAICGYLAQVVAHL
ncbi:hypothetical protein P8452_06571 [Trifolium repens]|nr:hypothetical protein P8452_06571 [Trifolium repens]